MADKKAQPQASVRKFAAERSGCTHKFVIYGADESGSPQRHKGYLVVNAFEDGTVGEIFIHMDRVGSTYVARYLERRYVQKLPLKDGDE